MLRRIKVQLDIERKITTAFIVSTLFCKKTKFIYKKEYLEVDYAKTVIQWALDYFKQYQTAPGIHIQDIYDVEKESLKESEADTISVFLESLSDEYEKAESLNVDYLADQARKYFRKRALEILFEKGNKYASAGKVEEAEKLLLKHKQVSKATSGRFDPFNVFNIRNYDVEDLSNRLFKLPSALGDLVGWFERSWLVAVIAPEKRGKSWLLEEIIFSALLRKLKVFWVSLEMSKLQLEKRIYQKLTGSGLIEEYCFYPVFDCQKNQDNSCLNRNRINSIKLFDEDGNRPELKKRSEYKVCTLCRGENKKYIPAYWYQYEKMEKLKIKKIEQKAKAFISMYGGNLRVKAFPRFSANIEDIINELDDLEFSENFLPDVIVIDYLDILAQGKNRLEGRDKVDYIWKQAARIAGERNCLVVNADQSDAMGRNQRSLNDSNWSEDKRKDSHIDMRIALNQTAREKADKVMRINVLMHRHNYFHPMREVLCLQELSLGQPLLDSEPWNESLDRK
jgi:replicative DNA helicase